MSPARGSSRPKQTVTAPEPVEEPTPEVDPVLAAIRHLDEAGETPINLASKTSAIMAHVHRVEKRGKNTQQGYDFAREGDIADMIRELLAVYRVGFFGSLLEVQRHPIVSKGGSEGTLAILRMQFRLTCADSGDIEESYWEGDATDYTDKALPKAVTACKKSWLVFRFLVSTGDPEPDEGGEEFQRPGRGTSADTTQRQQQTQRQAQERGPDLRPSSPSQRQRLFGLGRTVPFLVDADSQRVSQERLHNLVAWATRKDPSGPVTSLTDLNRHQIDRVFRTMERCAADVGAAAATDRAMSHWIETGEDLPRSAAEGAPQPADDESDAPSAPPPGEAQFDASRLAEEARAADEAAEAGDVEEAPHAPQEGEEPLFPAASDEQPPAAAAPADDELNYDQGDEDPDA